MAARHEACCTMVEKGYNVGEMKKKETAFGLEDLSKKQEEETKGEEEERYMVREAPAPCPLGLKDFPAPMWGGLIREAVAA